jgi:PilZ domain-containing protein
MLFKRNFAVTRRSKRQWLNTTVRIFTDRGRMEALGINLSEGGMGLFAVAHLPIGSQVQVEFRPPESDDTVRIPAMIRHRALYLYGIEFLPQLEERRTAALGHSSARTPAVEFVNRGH